MDEPIAFLKARLDEDERAAKEASTAKAHGDEWHAGDGGDGWTQAGTPVLRPDENAVAIAIGDYAARHIACHDPARALREVEAKWRIVNDYEISVRACREITGSELDSPGYQSMCGGRDALRAACLALTWAWSDHPDFQPRWKP